MTERRNPPSGAKHRMIAVALLVGATLLGTRSVESLVTTRDLLAPDALDAARDGEAFFACLEDDLRSLAPPGTTVFLDIDDDLLYQRAAAAAFPERQLVTSSEEADMVVAVRDPSSLAPCESHLFEARPPPRGP